MKRAGIRWTVGNVSGRGFAAVRLSILGAVKIFGPDASNAVCVNGISPGEAEDKIGCVPPDVESIDSSRFMPDFLSCRFDERYAEGIGWKFAPLRIFPDPHENSPDNDCILRKLPESIGGWLERSDSITCVLATDVREAHGIFAPFRPPEAWNSGIRGLPPSFDLEAAFWEIFEKAAEGREGKVTLANELDEQGLQAAAVSLVRPSVRVTLDEVSVCPPGFR